MVIRTEAEYLEARAELNRCNKAIDDAPARAKPVFDGIAELHTAIHRYENRNTKQ